MGAGGAADVPLLLLTDSEKQKPRYVDPGDRHRPDALRRSGVQSHSAADLYPAAESHHRGKTKNADTAELEQLLLRPEATNTEVPQAQP